MSTMPEAHVDSGSPSLHGLQRSPAGPLGAGVCPLSRQTLELLEPTRTGIRGTSPAALLCRVEELLLRVTGATSVEAFLVDRWFNKLLRFSVVDADGGDAAGDAEGNDRGAGAAATAAAASVSGGGVSSSTGGAPVGSRDETPPRETVFEATAVCDIGEGVAGMAAATCRNLRVRDCRRQHKKQHQHHEQQQHQGRGLERSAYRYGTPHDSGSLVCWPVRALATSSAGPKPSGGTTAAAVAATAAAAVASREGSPPLAELEDVDFGVEDADEDCEDDEGDDDDDDDDGHGLPSVATAAGPTEGAPALAVLQLHHAEGCPLSVQAAGLLRNVGRLLAPLLSEALAHGEERARRRSAEALLSLPDVASSEMNVVALVEEVLRAAQAVTEAGRACFFFVDDTAGELWVARAVDFDNAKIKIGEGLCGHAAATGQTVNVIDSYRDRRFDRRWDRLTGFRTRRSVGAAVAGGVVFARTGVRGASRTVCVCVCVFFFCRSPPFVSPRHHVDRPRLLQLGPEVIHVLSFDQSTPLWYLSSVGRANVCVFFFFFFAACWVRRDGVVQSQRRTTMTPRCGTASVRFSRQALLACSSTRPLDSHPRNRCSPPQT